ncbi:MAG TPA: alpha-1,4-glucan--maltose-1-phosphate maltosyltransferase [Steroidobacteraceae bacterium]|nr:alpha-1,4-glucan--maltose-1-phosphate maltosyltransferase [Steroidobacteraceae bacterium]
MSKARVVIENITPQVDCGRFPVKRTVGEPVTVEADVFADGHDVVSCALLHRERGSEEWQHVPMTSMGNDRWCARFVPRRLGFYEFTVCGWVDHLATWRRDLAKKEAAGQDVRVDLLRGKQLEKEGVDEDIIVRHDPPLLVEVDREKARFSTWYELFPRSTGKPGVHGTFADVEARLPYVASMGFDVLYLPPIHPIGLTERKAPNNKPGAGKNDPGSPWAIGGEGGGHKAIHPQLGTLADFRRLVARAQELGMEIALDIAFQCSPDHPYVREHPEWFLRRPDGTIQYAENPPKKYQDIYPFHFETDAWRELWEELKSIFTFWIAQGVRVFRVDNPHTKPFALWQWIITEVKREHPDVIFLSEAFTRPKVMYRLAKVGFTQSYTYFTWRNTKRELIEYFTELTTPPVSDFFRPNLWPNTPDILPEFLQFGGRPAAALRLVLAATLGASYGIYGPAFELFESAPREPGSEEYLDSEKYQLRTWPLDRPDSLRDLIARVNRIRRDNPALQSNRGLRFHPVDNESLIAYSKTTEDGTDSVLTIVNLDPHNRHTGWIELDLAALGLEPAKPFQVHDLLSGARFLWQGARNFIALDPAHTPAHIFRIRRRVRTEHDFDYFM